MNTETKHTPGPWTASQRASGNYYIYALGSSNPIAGISFAGEGKANAQLIAASPVLLALLKELIDIEGPQPGTAGWAARVQNEIDKAEGRS